MLRGCDIAETCSDVGLWYRTVIKRSTQGKDGEVYDCIFFVCMWQYLKYVVEL